MHYWTFWQTQERKFGTWTGPGPGPGHAIQSTPSTRIVCCIFACMKLGISAHCATAQEITAPRYWWATAGACPSELARGAPPGWGGAHGERPAAHGRHVVERRGARSVLSPACTPPRHGGHPRTGQDPSKDVWVWPLCVPTQKWAGVLGFAEQLRGSGAESPRRVSVRSAR